MDRKQIFWFSDHIKLLRIREEKKSWISSLVKKHSLPIDWVSLFRFMGEGTSLEPKTQQG